MYFWVPISGRRWGQYVSSEHPQRSPYISPFIHFGESWWFHYPRIGRRHKDEEQKLAVLSQVFWEPDSETEMRVQEEVLLGSALGSNVVRE